MKGKFFTNIASRENEIRNNYMWYYKIFPQLFQTYIAVGVMKKDSIVTQSYDRTRENSFP